MLVPWNKGTIIIIQFLSFDKNTNKDIMVVEFFLNNFFLHKHMLSIIKYVLDHKTMGLNVSGKVPGRQPMGGGWTIAVRKQYTFAI